MTDDDKLQKALERGLDRLSVNVPSIVMGFTNRNSNLQMRMMDLIMGFISSYANMYRYNAVSPDEKMYSMCEMCHKMLTALDSGPPVDMVESGRHRKES